MAETDERPTTAEIEQLSEQVAWVRDVLVAENQRLVAENQRLVVELGEAKEALRFIRVSVDSALSFAPGAG